MSTTVLLMLLGIALLVLAGAFRRRALRRADRRPVTPRAAAEGRPPQTNPASDGPPR